MQDLLSIIIRIVFYLILLGAGALAIFLIYKLLTKKNLAVTTDCCTLAVEVPKDNEKSPLAAEQMFAALHSILRTKEEQKASRTAQEHISFELVSQEKFLRFYVHTPRILKDFVEGQIYAQYPKVDLKEVDDYTKSVEDANLHSVATEVILDKEDVYPIKTFLNFDVDPLAAITAVLSKVRGLEQIWVQVLTRPIDDTWQNKGIDYVERIKTNTTEIPSVVSDIKTGVKSFGKDLFRAAVNPEAMAEEAEGSGKEEKIELPGPVQAAAEGIETKVTKLGFSTKIRVIAFAEDESTAKMKLRAAAGSFKQFNTINLNNFILSDISIDDDNFLADYRGRMFDIKDTSFILNIEELASIYHLPNVSVETPTIVWAGSKKGEPPSDLPIVGSTPDWEFSPFAKTDFQNQEVTFGIKLPDRRHHMYAIGKTGTGKTTMLENMAIADISEGKGVAIVDPHGDFVDRILDFIPPERVNDVVVFDPSDREYPVGFNLLEKVDPDMKNIITSGLIGIFQKIWAFTWGPRLEHILRNTILALLDYPDSTMLGILKMLIDNNFRERVIAKITDPVVKEFWEKEFTGYNERLRSEAVSPIQNKVGQFVSSSTIRNIIGQTKSTIDIKEIMDNKKILLINLSKGKIGEDNSALLGAMMITKIQLAAMQRANIPAEERQDFYLYVDEFQNFATESFATIFSEARKYKLNIIVANQYIAQMQEEVREAIFGNVGTIVSFRVGASDAPYLVKEFAPVFEEQDLVNLDSYHIYTKLSIEGVTSPAFSGITLPPAHEAFGLREKVKEQSRDKYGRPLAEIERAIAEWSERESLPLKFSEVRSGEKPRDFNRPERKVKGPSAVFKLDDGRKFEEFTHWDGKKWYQEVGSRKDEDKPQNPPQTGGQAPPGSTPAETPSGVPQGYDIPTSTTVLKQASRSILNPLWQMSLTKHQNTKKSPQNASKMQEKPISVNTPDSLSVDQPSEQVNRITENKIDIEKDDKKGKDIIDITGFEGKSISI